MNNREYINKLDSELKQLKDDDLIPAFFLMEMYIEFDSFRDFHKELDRDFMQKFIQRLNTIKELSEIRKAILDYYSDKYWECIDDYLREIENFRFDLKNRGRDLSKYKTDKRLLAFALNYYDNKFSRREKTINDIVNNFYRLLFIIFCHPDYSQSKTIVDRIEENYSQIINQHSIHFEKNDNYDFYRWAKKYMDGQEKYRSRKYSPTTDEEYKMTVNIIFDKIFDDNEDVYSSLKDKLSNAWYQKKYREKNRGKKPCHYTLTKRTQEALHVLAFKLNTTEDKVIEKLVNEYYVNNCVDNLGNSLY